MNFKGISIPVCHLNLEYFNMNNFTPWLNTSPQTNNIYEPPIFTATSNDTLNNKIITTNNENLMKFNYLMENSTNSSGPKVQNYSDEIMKNINNTTFEYPMLEKAHNQKSQLKIKGRSKNQTNPQQSTANVKKGKRHRTIFTADQLERLEAEFEQQQYMVGSDRVYLAKCLRLTELQIKIWFQNRRIKWRRQHPWEPIKKGDESP